MLIMISFEVDIVEKTVAKFTQRSIFKKVEFTLCRFLEFGEVEFNVVEFKLNCIMQKGEFIISLLSSLKLKKWEKIQQVVLTWSLDFSAESAAPSGFKVST